MPVNIGTAGVKEIYIGNQKVKEVYIGNQKVYGAVSYKYALEFNNYDDLNDFNLGSSQRRNFILENGNLSFASRHQSAEARLNRFLGSGEKLSIKVKIGYGMIKLTDSNGFIFSMYSEDSLLRIGIGYKHYYLSGSYKDQWLTFNVERNSSKYTIEVFDENSEKKVSYSFLNYDVYSPRLNFYSGSTSSSLIDYIRFE